MRGIKIAGPFSNIVFSKQLMVCLALWAIVIIQALGVIYTKQSKRLLHAQLQGLYTMRDKLQVEWSRLLLEQGTWESDARVERVAREQLGMEMPHKVNVIIP